MMFFLFILHLISSLTGASAICDGAQASVVRVTRLSTTAASVEFTYFHQPGLSLNLSIFNASSFPVDQVLSEHRVFYDYLYDELVVHQLHYCFGIAEISDVENKSTVFDNSLACSSIAEVVQTVPQLSHMLSSYDPTEVLFQWTLTSSVETILYCTEPSSLLITHKEHMHAATREVALPGFKPATQYTCYISSKTDTGISNSSSTNFTTRPRPPYNLTGTLIGSDSLTVSWQNDYPPGHSFTVQAIVGCSESSQDSTLTRTSIQAIIALTELSPYTLYCITVSSEVHGATSALSATLMVRTLGTAPGPVHHLMATPISSTTVLVRWSVPAMQNGDITGYLVEVMNCPLCVGCNKSVGGNVTFFICTGLDPRSEYRFRVAAVTREGQGVWTTESTRTLDQEIVDKPTQACSTLPTVAGSLIGGIVIGILLSVVLVIIVLLLVFRRRLLQVVTKKGGIGNTTLTAGRAATRYIRKNPNSDSSRPQTQVPVNFGPVYSWERPDSVNQEVEEEQSYEMVPYYADEEGSDTAASKSNAIDSVPVSKERTQSIDSDYEIPKNTIVPEGEGDLSAAAVQKYPILVSEVPRKVEKEHTMSVPSGASGEAGEEKALTEAQRPPLDHGVSSSLSTKTEAAIPDSCKEGNNLKNKPLLPKPVKSANKKPAVASKPQVLESTLGGAGAPKLRPKPQGKGTSNIKCTENIAYKKWSAK